MDFNYSSADRLKSGRQFDLVFRTGRRETGALVRLLFLTKMDGRALVGVTVGKKIAGAVMRARGRRMMRESFRRLLPWIREGTWIVASLRENALDAKADEVYADMARSLAKRRLLTPVWRGADWNIDSR